MTYNTIQMKKNGSVMYTINGHSDLNMSSEKHTGRQDSQSTTTTNMNITTKSNTIKDKINMHKRHSLLGL